MCFNDIFETLWEAVQNCQFKIVVKMSVVRILTVIPWNYRENGVCWHFKVLACHSHRGWNYHKKRIVTWFFCIRRDNFILTMVLIAMRMAIFKPSLQGFWKNRSTASDQLILGRFSLLRRFLQEPPWQFFGKWQCPWPIRSTKCSPLNWPGVLSFYKFYILPFYKFCIT